jgi:mevalonate pyrophosphate decarboxylase
VTTVAFGVGAARTALGRPTVSVVLEIALKRVVPGALGAAVVAAGFASFLESAPSAALSDLSARTILALALLVSGHFVVQVVRERRRPAVTTLNPWL